LILKERGVKVQVLSAEQEPSVRYSSFLEILGSNADVVIGTRNAVFAPLQNLGLIAIWDDADENYYSQQSPYWNAREVAILRARLNACDFMSFGNCESVAINQLIKDKAIIRVPFIDSDSKNYWPQVFTLDNSSSDPIERTKRIPNKAWELVKEGLKSGNVLIQVPRLGYSSNLQCSSCRESARCNGCSGPLLTKQKNSAPECKWCGKVASSWRCRYCNTREFRISVVGQTKTVEELGKSFPGVNILTSGGATILRNVEESNSIIVATPGAEPKTPNGYSAAILLDAYLLLGVPSLAASEEALRKWLHLFTLLKPESDGGKVFITSESTNRVVQALIKHDPNWLINNEQELRTETKLHPSVTTISLKGDLKEINQLLETFNNDASISVMGPRIFEKEELAQIVIGTSKPEDIISKVRSEIIKFSVARTKPVRAHVNAYDID
jgi:primosomal protein N' (replication factor Y) (superfamily II helicase)